MKICRLDTFKDKKAVQWSRVQASSHYAECVINCRINDAGVRTVTPTGVHYSAVVYTSTTKQLFKEKLHWHPILIWHATI